MHSLGILLSGRGSNFVAIADSIDAGRIRDARIAVVISNKADAPGIATARQRGLNALVIPSKGRAREEHDREVVAALQDHGVELVCLAGYMRLLSPWFVQQFPQRILNIHPSLLPAFPGLEAQEQAFAYGVKVSGCTVHFVDEELDHGAIIVQKAVPVLDGDDEHTLAERILEQEHVAYTEAINIVLGGKFEIVGRRLRQVRSQNAECRSKILCDICHSIAQGARVHRLALCVGHCRLKGAPISRRLQLRVMRLISQRFENHAADAESTLLRSGYFKYGANLRSSLPRPLEQLNSSRSSGSYLEEADVNRILRLIHSLQESEIVGARKFGAAMFHQRRGELSTP